MLGMHLILFVHRTPAIASPWCSAAFLDSGNVVVRHHVRGLLAQQQSGCAVGPPLTGFGMLGLVWYAFLPEWTV